jgi:hypothetical protein
VGKGKAIPQQTSLSVFQFKNPLKTPKTAKPPKQTSQSGRLTRPLASWHAGGTQPAEGRGARIAGQPLQPSGEQGAGSEFGDEGEEDEGSQGGGHSMQLEAYGSSDEDEGYAQPESPQQPLQNDSHEGQPPTDGPPEWQRRDPRRCAAPWALRALSCPH